MRSWVVVAVSSSSKHYPVATTPGSVTIRTMLDSTGNRRFHQQKDLHDEGERLAPVATAPGSETKGYWSTPGRVWGLICKLHQYRFAAGTEPAPRGYR